MNQSTLEKALADLPLGRIEYLESVGSTNDIAANWVVEKAKNLSLVVANEQTEGRGRSGRAWFTPPGSALAFSVIIHIDGNHSPKMVGRMPGLGALAVCEALEESLKLKPAIKWPNDVLLDGKKVSGVLVEAQWLGESLEALIIGIGINIATSSIPSAKILDFPATSIESVLNNKPVDRVSLLENILKKLLYWRERLEHSDFIDAWQKRLAYNNQWVQIISDDQSTFDGLVGGLDEQGRLMLLKRSGEEISLHSGEIQLRPLVDRL
ncbi:MAG: biotin--[acetyl-CoA-carboxylase] ligase [Chloroflexi bacterium]|nr:biotin--[acetyl-CoA-carboxylase] ligase [Chloroflexota bacterium]